jgi:hypothetical protein
MSLLVVSKEYPEKYDIQAGVLFHIPRIVLNYILLTSSYCNISNSYTTKHYFSVICVSSNIEGFMFCPNNKLRVMRFSSTNIWTESN